MSTAFESHENPPYDVLVVGGGPAGLAAATWLGRFRVGTLLLDSCEYRNRWVEKAHGYLGFDPINPLELIDKGRKDLENYSCVELVCSAAKSVTAVAGGFEVRADDASYVARRVVLATGTSDVFPDVRGFLEHYGSQVFHCPFCDGYEARDKNVAVLGWSAEVAEFAAELLNWAKSVTVIAQGNQVNDDRELEPRLASSGIGLCREMAVELVGGRGELAGVRLESGEQLNCDYVFFSLPERPVNRLARQLGCDLDEEGHVIVDEDGRTSVEGVFAAGDLTPGEQLIQIAAGEGIRAAIACVKSLRANV